MANKGLVVVIGGFITLILGLVLISSLSSSEYNTRTLDTVTADTETLVNSSCTKITNGCIETVSSVVNSTVTYTAGNYTVCASSTGNTDGLKLTGNTLFATTAANVSYTVSPTCSYVKDSTSRTLVGIVILLFAIAIMIAAVYYVKESGLLDMF